MEPTLPNPEAPETPTVNYGSETYRNGDDTSPNRVGESSPRGVSTTQSSTPVPPVASNIPEPASAVNAVNPTQSADDDNPTLADDVDVIEKEWVDKARKIVNNTKDSPYEQEKEVSKLQADYLMKRYGKQVKIPE